jgi:hypothetical protein
MSAKQVSDAAHQYGLNAWAESLKKMSMANDQQP